MHRPILGTTLMHDQDISVQTELKLTDYSSIGITELNHGLVVNYVFMGASTLLQFLSNLCRLWLAHGVWQLQGFVTNQIQLSSRLWGCA